MSKKSIWHTFAEPDLYEMVLKMGYTEKHFLSFQRRRFFKSCLITLAAVPPGLLINKLWFLFMIVLFFYVWFTDYKKARKEYQFFLFKKQLVFAKFMRIVLPYLKDRTNNVYSILKNIVRRIDDVVDNKPDELELKKSLEKLLFDIRMYPGSIEPYKRFAIESGGTDSAVSFMTILYDYEQQATDEQVINELGKKASNELFDGIDEIVRIKLNRFAFFPTKITLAQFIIFIGVMSAAIYDLLTNLNFE
ncbi:MULTISPECIES: hypothetical protein [Bacillus]|uniref:hypothetical protein n=1 Tax=Bacillus TaxID=1386 RepID=UPI000D048183|nr:MULTISPECIES: hypothetical protein [Bacillus]PRS35724.1 hypothetical protein C6Y02_17075 [Bacillus sp. NMCC4]UUD44649.1 hypothetical protein NPA43_19125 [Bacillus pumilus]